MPAIALCEHREFMTPSNLVEQEFWDGGYAEAHFSPLAADDFFRVWLQTHVPRGTGDCIEIGCFPGGFLAALGDLGYRLNGIDLTPRVEEMPNWLAPLGYAIGTFTRGDFETFSPGRRYDVVSSFGFIEHFTTWAEVLARHCDLVAPGGYLVIETPNFSGLTQRVLRQLFDPQDLARHHLPAMHVEAWADVVTLLGFEIVHVGPLGKFHFWRAEAGEGMRFELATLLDVVMPVLATREETSTLSTAGFLGLVARRIKDGPPPHEAARIAELASISEAAAAYDRSIEPAAKELFHRAEAWIKYMNSKWQIRS